MKKYITQPTTAAIYKEVSKIQREMVTKDQFSQALDSVGKKLINHDQELVSIRREMVTKNEFNQMINSVDKVLLIVTRLDQERVFTTEWTRRIERDVEKLKRRLQVA